MERKMTDDEKLAHIETCLYELKERTSVPGRIRAIDNFMADVSAELLVELFDIVYQTHS
jgi:hypothetical protein